MRSSTPRTATATAAIRCKRLLLVCVISTTLLSGCATAPREAGTLSYAQLEQEAVQCLKAGLQYPYNPAVRVAAVQGLEVVGDSASLAWIRTALLDEHPAVRFAGAVAVGRLADRGAELAVRECLRDADASVRVAALFALHRLGDTSRTGAMADYLLDHEDVAVRRNAAMLLGLLGEPGAIKLLARAMRDPDQGVRQHVLEALARLGNGEAKQELTFMTSSGVGSEEVFAIGALAATGDPAYIDTFRYKLATGMHLETKLAAARGLGLLGEDDGFKVAVSALRTRRTPIQDPQDPPAGQAFRAKQMALTALGAIGHSEALPDLRRYLEESEDPRIQVAAARAILQILAAQQDESLSMPEAAARQP